VRKPGSHFSAFTGGSSAVAAPYTSAGAEENASLPSALQRLGGENRPHLPRACGAPRHPARLFLYSSPAAFCACCFSGYFSTSRGALPSRHSGGLLADASGREGGREGRAFRGRRHYGAVCRFTSYMFASPYLRLNKVPARNMRGRMTALWDGRRADVATSSLPTSWFGAALPSLHPQRRAACLAVLRMAPFKKEQAAAWRRVSCRRARHFCRHAASPRHLPAASSSWRMLRQLAAAFSCPSLTLPVYSLQRRLFGGR